MADDELTPEYRLPEALLRTSVFMTHPVFHMNCDEAEMTRYIRRLADRDLALDRAMNRRKSRAGYALAHHVEAVLKAWDIRYKRGATTEKRNAADFLFPCEVECADPEFSAADLRMLAVKTICKDRWRQVLAEADRIRPKHLLTLEPSISRTQTS